jgi:hypothetical protein
MPEDTCKKRSDRKQAELHVVYDVLRDIAATPSAPQFYNLYRLHCIFYSQTSCLFLSFTKKTCLMIHRQSMSSQSPSLL